MAPRSSTLAWKTPWMEEPAGLQSMGSRRVRQDWATSLSCIGEGNGNPLQCSCLENPRDGGAWWAAVYWVAQSRTRLKWLSSSSSSIGIRMNCPKSSKESRKSPKHWLCNSLWQSCHSSHGMFFFFNKFCWVSCISMQKKSILTHTSTPWTKNNFRWIIDLNVRS